MIDFTAFHQGALSATNSETGALILVEADGTVQVWFKSDSPQADAANFMREQPEDSAHIVWQRVSLFNTIRVDVRLDSAPSTTFIFSGV
jgi:hypothetical protein